jgi:hypothetical protein
MAANNVPTCGQNAVNLIEEQASQKKRATGKGSSIVEPGGEAVGAVKPILL